MKIAIVHDWLDKYAGSERVLEQIVDLFPEADLFSLVDFLEDRKFIKNKKVHTSFIQKLPFAKKKFRYYLFLFPLAIESFDLFNYDLIISSSHCLAKSVKKRKNQMHISYIHTPARYVWDLRSQYLEETGLNKGLKKHIVNLILDYIKNYDLKTVNRIDYVIASSYYIKQRIKRCYNLDAHVIYPPVDVNKFSLNEKKEEFYLTVSRLEPYKKVSLIVEAFNRMLDKKLVVIGDGSEMGKIKKIAGKNVEILGFQPDSIVKKYIESAKAFIFAAEEDFGIVLVEAQSAGTPVVAFRKGGATETVLEGITGVFFDFQTPESIVEGVKKLDQIYDTLDFKKIREHSLQFSVERFRKEFFDFINKILEKHQLNLFRNHPQI
uniref:Glycosyltransferase family 4 protein n=1 Tax=Thermodesulfobacterium geofontis TaxID=1295609 RepID=A0A7V6CDH8_9BACT